jgi:hypothetical protein
MYMVADGNCRGYQLLLDAFWDEARSFGLSLPTGTAVTAASFCTARQKIDPEALRRGLRDIATDTFPSSFGESQRWHGRRVFAVDGTKINLQRGYELEREFGIPNDAHCPQALASVMLDVCAKAPVDIAVSGFASSERDHLFEMLESLHGGDILVLDRGYPSHEVLQTLACLNIDYLIRVPSKNSFSVIDEWRWQSKTDPLGHQKLTHPAGSPPLLKWALER